MTESQIQRYTVSDAVCSGSLAIGSGCRQCKRCFDELFVRCRRLKRMSQLIGQRWAVGLDIERASGDAICEECGLELRDHPHCHAVDSIVIACNGQQYKL